MAKKLSLAKQEELFTKDCKLINLKYEYNGYIGEEKWAIITELAENELLEKYSDVLSRYTPFVLLSIAQGEIISEFVRNKNKYAMRELRNSDIYGYDDEVSTQFHSELSIAFNDPFEKEEEECAEQEIKRQRQLSRMKVRLVLSKMRSIQVERLLKNVCCGMSSRKIAKQEGVNYSTVDKSIAAAKKNFKKFYENL